MFVVPFMPLYVQQLGVPDAANAAAWAGFINGASGASMALVAPLWGRLSDRLGRKLMLLRATLTGFALGPIGGGLLVSALGFWAAFFIPGAALLVLTATLAFGRSPRLRSGKGLES